MTRLASFIAPLLLAAALAPAAVAQALPPSALSRDELDLLRKSMRPGGLAELEAHTAPLAQLPLSEVEATLDLEQAHLEGHLRLIYTNRESKPLTDLVLRLMPSAPVLKSSTSLKADEVQINGQPVRARSHGSLLEIDLPAPLASGSALTLSLAFHGRLKRLRLGDDSLAPTAEMLSQLAPGLGALSSGGARAAEAQKGYGTFAVSGQGAVLLDWYPLLAARVGGAWDRNEAGPLGDPLRSDVGSAIVALTVPRGARVIGAGAALGQHESGGGEVAAFAIAGTRGSLGLAVMRDPSELSEELHPEGDSAMPSVHVRVASLHGPLGARAMLGCARAALNTFAPRWGAYPWSDFVLAEMPLTGGAGGVEQSGLALVARALGGGVSNPLAGAQDPTDPLPEIPGIFSFTCHHEVAHQWFPGVVGSDPRGTPWLDEAFAQDAAVRAAEAAAGGGEAGKLAGDSASRRFVALNYQGMRLMGLPDGRVERRTDEFKSPVAYAGLVYGKAPLYLARVRQVLGDERFDAALRSLRGQRAFREASGSDFLGALDRIDPARAPQLDALADRWLREQHGDEDIGEADLADLMETMGGGAASAQLSQLMKILGSPGGAQGGGVNGYASPPGGNGPNRYSPSDERELRRALQQLEKQLPELRQLIEQLDIGHSSAPP